jgi:transcriptional regulator with XRE-family HTH domain
MYTKRKARSPFFAERLCNLRCSGNWTQGRLGKVVGVSAAMIHYWENEKSYPNAAYMEKLAAALGTSVAYLTGGSAPLGHKVDCADDVSRSALIDVVEAARQRIAEAAGLPVKCVQVVINLSELSSDSPDDHQARSE